MWRLRSFLVFLLCFAPGISQSGESIPRATSSYSITGEFAAEKNLGLYLDLYEDKNATWTIEKALSAARDGHFAPSTRIEHSLGTTDSSWWAHFTLVNKADRPLDLVLTQDYPHIDRLELWEAVNDSLHMRQSGDSLPFSKREIATNTLPFVLQLAPQSTHSFMLRYQTDGSMHIDLKLYSPVAFVEAMAGSHTLQGVFFGALLALALYNLFIYFIVRDSSYLLYVLYMLSFGLFISGFSGYSAQYLWPESPWLINMSLLFFWGAVIAMSLLFSKNFLSLALYSPRINRIANIFIGIAVACSVAAVILPYALVVKVLFLLAPPAYLLVLLAAYKGIRRGYTPARYFMTAWVTLMLCAIAATLISAGIIPSYTYPPLDIIEFGAFIEMVLLSIALASRIRSLEKQSSTDSLTRLFNRRSFDQQILRLMALTKRQKRLLSLMVIDVDHFKQFNDRYGHDQGDLVLQRVADILSETARQSDYLFRYGGEEFVVLMPETDQKSAVEAANRMRQRVSRSQIEGSSVTISIGVAVYDGNLELDAKELFRLADDALYRAKQSGRNRVEVCSIEG